jgi:hypothetical protein
VGRLFSLEPKFDEQPRSEAILARSTRQLPLRLEVSLLVRAGSPLKTMSIAAERDFGLEREATTEHVPCGSATEGRQSSKQKDLQPFAG